MKPKHIINAARPRLSDEELDLIEIDEVESNHIDVTEEWLPWGAEDLSDIYRVIDRMPEQQQQIMNAFLEGKNFKDIGVGEKYFHYWYNKSVEFIQKELGL